MPSVASAVVALLAVGAAALRQRRITQNRSSVRPAGVPGEVDGIFTYGAPAGSAPAMTYPGGRCFPGLRVVAAKKFLNQQRVDIVPPLTRPLGYKHPKMRAAKIFMGESRVEWAPCGEDFDSPIVEIPSGALHNEQDTYYPEAWKYDLGALAYKASKIANPQSSTSDSQEVADAIRPYGWRLAASSFDGNSVSHLMQEPESMECFLTFRGSKSFQDWVGNVYINKVEFCGLDERVHRGFRDNLRSVVSSEEWQTKIRPSLPSCSKVYATGHSLGGITGVLFAACAANAFRASSENEDYKLIGWTTGTARVLPHPWG